MNTTQSTDTEPVEMIDTKGKRHLVKAFASRTGQINWCSRKWITTKGKFSSNYGQVDITGWTEA